MGMFSNGKQLPGQIGADILDYSMTNTAPESPAHTLDPRAAKCRVSIVIPVYNSEGVVGRTIDATNEAMRTAGVDYEIILVNDGSPDASWSIIRQAAESDERVTAIDLLRNYGQHTALLCGLRIATGDYVATIDDDMQNPPGEIIALLNKAMDGHDAVFGRFRVKQHAGYRRAGSRLIGMVNDRVFNKPKDLVLSNYRLLRRDVVDRMCAYRSTFPYIPGLAIMFATSPANEWVEHHPRPVGKSNYNLIRILSLVARILFNYSSYPLRLVTTLGMIVTVISFALGTFYLTRALITEISVPGWTTIVVLLSFFNGVSLLIMGMLGEYMVRLIRHTSAAEPYYVRERVGPDG